jgi:hypothetical protein
MYKVSNEETECRNCLPGRIAAEAGANECKNCTVGEYQSKEGLPYCLPCIPYVYIVVLFFPFPFPSDHIMTFFSLSLITEVNSGTLKVQPPVSHALKVNTKVTKMRLFATTVEKVPHRRSVVQAAANVLVASSRINKDKAIANHAFQARTPMSLHLNSVFIVLLDTRRAMKEAPAAASVAKADTKRTTGKVHAFRVELILFQTSLLLSNVTFVRLVERQTMEARNAASARMAEKKVMRMNRSFAPIAYQVFGPLLVI